MSLKVFFPFTCCRFKNKQLVASRHWRSISQGPLGGWVIDSKPIGCYHIWGRNLHFLQLIYSTLLGARILTHIPRIKHVQKKSQEIYPTVSSHMVGLTVPLCCHKKIRNTVLWLIIMFESSCCYKLWVRFGDEPRYNVFGDIFHHASIYHGSG